MSNDINYCKLLWFSTRKVDHMAADPFNNLRTINGGSANSEDPEKTLVFTNPADFVFFFKNILIFSGKLVGYGTVWIKCIFKLVRYSGTVAVCCTSSN